VSQILLGGETRRLAYPFGSVKRLKVERGVNLLKLKDLDFLDPTVMSALLWGGLIADRPETTEAEADSWLDMSRFGEITSAVADAILESQGRPDPLTSGASSGVTPVAPPTA
jgi:hypothetical protein